MSKAVLQKTIDLRAEVWRELVNSPLFQSFKALDVAVGSMGGSRILNDESPAPVVQQRAAASDSISPRRRLSQGDIAAVALRDAGVPMQIRALMDEVIASGVVIRGEDPLANFRSSLSRDSRFKSIMRNGGYYWWLVDADLPEGWKEAAVPDLPGLAAASDSSSQEGGGDHAANVA